MSYPINYPTPQGANVQMFREGGSTSDWVKPQGASFVWFTLIGAGGGGASNGGGGGSGAVTNFMCPAFLIPDVLRVNVGQGSVGAGNNVFGTDGTNTTVVYQQKNGAGYTLLTANAGTGASGLAGGAATAANFFTAMGFYQSIAGQTGVYSAAITASATTFLSGGSGSESTVTANYGYTLPASLPADPGPTGASGNFYLQPMIVGVGGAGGGRASSAGQPSGNGGDGGIGCGGGDGATQISGGTGYGTGGRGGDGLVVIITW